MTYSILSARWGNAARDSAVLQTSDTGEAHVDLTRAAGDPARHNPLARAAFDAWLAEGNTPAPYVAPSPAPVARNTLAELDEIKARLGNLERTKP